MDLVPFLIVFAICLILFGLDHRRAVLLRQQHQYNLKQQVELNNSIIPADESNESKFRTVLTDTRLPYVEPNPLDVNRNGDYNQKQFADLFAGIPIVGQIQQQP